jgi:ferrous iron transport protein A
LEYGIEDFEKSLSRQINSGGMNMTMAETKKGQFYTIRKIGGEARFLSRVTSVGLTPGTNVEVLQTGGKYPVLVYARDTMLAVNSREARQIGVEAMQP